MAAKDPILTSLVIAIPDGDQTRRGWRVVLNGKTVDVVHRLGVYSEEFGTWAYGLTPDGYDSWSFHEPGGGGSVILPFAQLDQGLVVGVVSQHRYNQGGEVFNAPRGFVRVGEMHHEAARRELHEETGYLHCSLIALDGEPANPNSTFFDTAAAGEGVHFFALHVPAEDIERDGGTLRPRGALIDLGSEATAAQLAERIGRTIFVPWRTAARLGDMFTNAAVARLIAYLEDTVGPA